MSEESTEDDVRVDVEVEVEVDRDELEIEVGDVMEAESELERDGLEIEVEVEVERVDGGWEEADEDDERAGTDDDLDQPVGETDAVPEGEEPEYEDFE